ncbi:MAG TPA: helix-turn-helix domain-containing protein [Edaphobacter sp.]|nr:helix-turn-helix domain-containing protein [Edaphobacter sp.]
MDQTRAVVLRAARSQLEKQGYRSLTMASLALASGVTRQTIHNLFGTKAGVLEALFDTIALDAGMNRMRGIMSEEDSGRMLEQFVQLFCEFWSKNRLLIRRIHGIGAIDPEFNTVIAARNERRRMAATRIIKKLGVHRDVEQRIAVLTALTSFEFFDALAQHDASSGQAEAIMLHLARQAVVEKN